ncbi:MAG: GNAT family N-acetyltransferase [Oscillochloris sp.]|nr:GNAT family N-acetyltransferase [Oscillochloris sp.]
MLELEQAFVPFPLLETERLILREITTDDADAMFQIMSDPQVMRYFGQSPLRDLDAAVQRITRFIDELRAGRAIRWAVTLRENGRYIGSCGYHTTLAKHFRAEIGYELAAEYWGRGFMPEALRPVLDFGFHTMGLNSIEAQIDPENSGSRRVLEKLGFVQEGLLRQSYYEPEHKRFTDTAIFGLLHQAHHRA